MQIDSQKIWVLSALDKLISLNKGNSTLMMALFQKKELILKLLPTQQIDAHKYKTIVAKAYKEETGVIKQCAGDDIAKLSNPKDPKVLNLWFREMIQNTGGPYENQKKLYAYYQQQQQPQQPVPSKPQAQQQPQPPQNPPKNQPVQPLPKVLPTEPPPQKVIPQAPPKKEEKKEQNIDDGPALDNVASLKMLDNMMDEWKGSASGFQKIFEKKMKLMELIKKKELTAEKYKGALELYFKKLKGTQKETDYKIELEQISDFHDGNVNSWFKEVVEQAQFNIQLQKDKLALLRKGPSKPTVKPKQSQTRESIPKQQIAQSNSFDINQLNSFKVLEEQLDVQVDNKQIYRQVLEKKKKLLGLAKQGNLTAEKYKALLIKSISEAKNTEIKEAMSFELSDLADLHDNDTRAWWNDIISNAELMLDDQEQTLKELESGKKIKKKVDDDDIDMKFLNGEDDDDDDIDINVDIDIDENLLPAKPQQKKQVKEVKEQGKITRQSAKPETKKQAPPTSKGSPLDSLFSLKAIDQYLTQYQKNPEKFMVYFERKQVIFGMMQSGQIDAEKYKVLQEKTLATTTDQKVKECVQMDLFDLKDMCDGNVNEWFQSLINDTGFNFEDQMKIYEQFKQKGGQGGKASGKVASQSLTSQEKPDIAQVVCFTALSRLFEISVKTSDILYYRELENKREKLMDLVDQKRLVAGKYRDINKAAAAKTQSPLLKACIQEQLQSLTSKFKDNEEQWFEELKKYLLADPPEIKLPENPEMKKINALPIRQKAEWLAKRMAPYQSLNYYTKTHQLPDENPALKKYEKTSKKQAVKFVDDLVKHPKSDVYTFAQTLFPPITSDVFYCGNLAALKKKGEASIKLLIEEAATLKAYGQKIKKATNTKNHEYVAKEVTRIQKDIAFLKQWPGKELVPFPTINQEKIQKYNLDVLDYLDTNEVQVVVTYIEGLGNECYLKIYAGNAPNERFHLKVRNGPQAQAKVVIKLPQKDMIDLIKGERTIVTARLFERGFWGSHTQIAKFDMKGSSLKRVNIIQEKVSVSHFVLHYEFRINRPLNPLTTDIMHVTIKSLPAFKNDPVIEKQLIKYLTAQLKQ